MKKILINTTKAALLTIIKQTSFEDVVIPDECGDTLWNAVLEQDNNTKLFTAE